MTDARDAADVSDKTGDVYGGMLCHSVGCCTGLIALGIEAPATSYVPLGTLNMAVSSDLVSAFLDPVDPPPRLQV